MKIFTNAFVLLMLLCLLFGCTSAEREAFSTHSSSQAEETTIPESVTEASAVTEAGTSADSTESTEVIAASSYISDGETFIRMRVQNIMQEPIGMNNGCEAVSLAIALGYYGFDVDPVELFEEHMKSGAAGIANPFYSYVGDPRGVAGYGCYAPCVVRCADSYLKSVGSSLRARDISGSSMDEICEYLLEGKPVIIWGTLKMQPSDVLAVWRFGGNPVYWYSYSHCVVLSGILSDCFFVCDPMEGIVRYPISDVERSYNQIYTQALIIE